MNIVLARRLFASLARSGQAHAQRVRGDALLGLANDIEYVDALVQQMGTEKLGEEKFFSYQQRISALREMIERKEKEL